MSIIRTSHNKENPYVMLNKSALEDPSLSWAAKGLWSYLMSRPDNWNVSVSHLCTIYKQKGGGEKAIYSLLNELIESGYCKREKPKNEKGLYGKIIYDILEFKLDLPHSPQRDVVQRDAVERDAVEVPPNNNRQRQKKDSIDKRQQTTPAVSCCSLDAKKKVSVPADEPTLDAEKFLEDRTHVMNWLLKEEFDLLTATYLADTYTRKEVGLAVEYVNEQNAKKKQKGEKITNMKGYLRKVLEGKWWKKKE